MLDQVINGLVLGNIYVLLAVGMALIFSVANLVNFSKGSVFMIGAYVGWALISQLGWPLWAALLAAALGCGLLGVLIERVALRPLEGAPPIAPLLSTVAVAFILDNLGLLLFKPETRAFNAPLPTWRLAVGGVNVGLLDILIALISLGCIGGLYLFLYHTRLGSGVRAAAQDRDAALQMGVDVDQARSLVFGIASALAGIAGTLLGIYYNSVNPAMGFSAGLKGLIAALLGGITSLPAALVGGLLLGQIESLATAYIGLSYRNLAAFLVLVLILALRPEGLLGRAAQRGYEVTTGVFFSVGKPRRVPRSVLVGVVLAAVLLPLIPNSDYVVQVLFIGLVYALLALGLNLVAGAGQVSLGQAGLFAIGAYGSALLTAKAGLPFWIALPASAILAAILGVALAYPALRLRGNYLAIATLGLAEIVTQTILNWEGLTNGPLGLFGIPAPRLGGLLFVGARPYYYLALVLVAVSAWTLTRLGRSQLGRTLGAIREDELAAETYGIETGQYKALAFGLGAAVAAVGGALFAHSSTYISPDIFTPAISVLVLTMVILGGLGSVPGVVASAVLLIALPEVARPVADARWLLYGVLLLLLVRFRPQGLLGREPKQSLSRGQTNVGVKSPEPGLGTQPEFAGTQGK
ncbi:MAG: ABC transporter permease [Anaerolineae bacterium]|nr:ABC transporter permease [Anaerolineae bacterium]